jgi:hypothetical protein
VILFCSDPNNNKLTRKTILFCIICISLTGQSAICIYLMDGFRCVFHFLQLENWVPSAVSPDRNWSKQSPIGLLEDWEPRVYFLHEMVRVSLAYRSRADKTYDNFIGGTVYYTYTNAEFIVRQPFRENKGLSISATAAVGVYFCTVTTQNSCSTSFQQEVIGLTCK